eukprot:g79405.t1
MPDRVNRVEKARAECYDIRAELLACRIREVPGYKPGQCLDESYNNACESNDIALRKCYSLALCGKAAKKLYEKPRTISRAEVIKYNNKVMQCLGKHYEALFDLSDIYQQKYGFMEQDENCTPPPVMQHFPTR